VGVGRWLSPQPHTRCGAPRPARSLLATARSFFPAGLVNNRSVYLPISAITDNSPRRLNPRGRTYERLLATTLQPDPLTDPEILAQWKARAVGAAGPKKESS
jgi:hypothetical protein